MFPVFLSQNKYNSQEPVVSFFLSARAAEKTPVSLTPIYNKITKTFSKLCNKETAVSGLWNKKINPVQVQYY